ncbi:uncharacterized protein BJ212DRAFT_511023 [Suillus subaureus]|uniref:Uncharacterized protein n=1 Tax=Suillus subaureus TaxID=48587 RepID=A0A9P7JAD7_9AGAM|nr:uncharacterized protein BJ212DRAFT_511023 [Suillus subaureus]KAG1811442.1 hypothetical protein BJ212DRAFT_511023 [Suillus subaureus]
MRSEVLNTHVVCLTVNFLQVFSTVTLARYLPKDTADDVQLVYQSHQNVADSWGVSSVRAMYYDFVLKVHTLTVTYCEYITSQVETFEVALP